MAYPAEVGCHRFYPVHLAQSFNPAEAGYQDLPAHRTLQPLHTLHRKDYGIPCRGHLGSGQLLRGPLASAVPLLLGATIGVQLTLGLSVIAASAESAPRLCEGISFALLLRAALVKDQVGPASQSRPGACRSRPVGPVGLLRDPRPAADRSASGCRLRPDSSACSSSSFATLSPC